MIRALLMDADGVLQRPQKGWLQELAKLGNGVGFVKDLFVEERQTMTGKVDLGDVLERLIDRWGLAITPQQVIQVWTRIDQDTQMLALVGRVRAAGVLTALATNQQSYRGTWMQEHLPYADYFDRSFYSFEMGLAKPDPAYFEHIVSQLGIAAGEAVFVDDLASNVRAARMVGLKAVRFAPFTPRWVLRFKLRRLGVPAV